MMQQRLIFRYTIIIILTCTALFLLWFFLNFNNENFITEPLTDYDYIIVGSGTTGCVLATQLSKSHKYSVLLVEAGDQFNFVSSIPLLATTLQRTKYDWSLKTVPQKHSSFGLYNQTQFLPRGKGLGGSGQLNYMIHGKVNPEDFDAWKDIPNWNYENISLYLKYLTETSDVHEEDQCPIIKNEPGQNIKKFCSLPINKKIKKSSRIYLQKQYTQLSKTFQKSAFELENLNLEYISLKSTIYNGKRWSSYHGYLKPALERNNLKVLLNVHVTKLIFNNKHVAGIEVLKNDGKKQIILSKKEVILSAGAFHTPQLLLLSGIGPANELKKFGIQIVTDLPGVGKNLHDHMNMPLYVSIKNPLSFTIHKALRIREMLNYFLYNEGLFASTPMTGLIKGPNDIGILLFGMGSTDEKVLKEVSNFKTETFRSLFPLYENASQEGFVFLATCLQPTSRGYVSIYNIDAIALPLINPQYLSTNYDKNCMLNAMKAIKSIAKTSSFKSIGAKIHWPKLKECKNIAYNSNNDEYLECILRTSALTSHHPGGTCKMGTTEDKYSVVDSSLRVKGISGLRVMDASILPKPFSTFPNTILIGMAEHASSIILKEQRVQRESSNVYKQNQKEL